MAKRREGWWVALLGVGFLLALAALTVFSLRIGGTPAAPAESSQAQAGSQPAQEEVTALSQTDQRATDEAIQAAMADATATAQGNQLATMQALVPPADTGLPRDWPPPPFSDKQLAEVRKCDIAVLQESRYPQTVAEGDLLAAYAAESTCDWAALAEAYARRLEPEEPLPEFAKLAFAQAVYNNPAFAFATPWMYATYADAIPLVELPPVARGAITTATLHFTFSGIGYQSEVSVTITEGDTDPIASGTVYENIESGGKPGEYSYDVSGGLEPELVQALGSALTDLFPIESQFRVIAVTDYYPDWEVQLTFEDGTTLDMRTNGSNLTSGGGPWQTQIDGQDYLQYSAAFPRALNEIGQALDLPLEGKTAAMSYGGDVNLLDAVSPELCETPGFECVDE